MAGPTYLILLQDDDGAYIHLYGPLGGIVLSGTSDGDVADHTAGANVSGPTYSASLKVGVSRAVVQETMAVGTPVEVHTSGAPVIATGSGTIQ